ncbi:GDP-mannose 4,6-dehydratase [Litoribrevibacter albus]|uniref:GDP-mannose 4,6-dehydratase n=1 Tax=Litoribrevibacter albus TaxID=1473156 RepID=A0AA37W6T5_9GAMM|nr:GDP-mannose 4,6-dehydratase [Litoribrevibacter albus]GLQ32232.1 GDP-mannose 4,6-dehydratase [Litoribrevibacter albus]
MKKKALITGVTGQDGAYLARFLLDQGYQVFGAYRRSATLDTSRLDYLGITDDVEFVAFDLLEFSNIVRTLEQCKPDEIYNLAAQSFVALSFEQPLYTSDVDGQGVLRILEAIRLLGMEKSTKFYQASTSEMFGKVKETPQTEDTPFHPRSPYGVAKLFAHWANINYRESYGLFGCNGILFNHESPLRGLEFVTRKITHKLAHMATHGGEPLELGNMEAKRDWGFAGDYVKGMWLMLQQDNPDDYVLATGQTYTVKEFVNLSAAALDIQLDWVGEGVNTQAINRKSGEVVVKVNPEFYRPSEVDLLLGDSSKAKSQLGWEPETTLSELVTMMVEADLKRVSKI